MELQAWAHGCVGAAAGSCAVQPGSGRVPGCLPRSGCASTCVTRELPMILRVRSVGGCKCRVQIVTTIELQSGLCGSCVAAAAEHCRLCVCVVMMM